MKILTIKNGLEVKVDNDTYEIVKDFAWRTNRLGYVIRTQNRYPDNPITVFLHHSVIPQERGRVIDHVNHDLLNNLRTNLRSVTHRQNCCNQRKPNGKWSSRFKGVSRHRSNGKWTAGIKVQYKRVYLGIFEIEIEAAGAYNQAAETYFGEFAKLNL